MLVSVGASAAVSGSCTAARGTSTHAVMAQSCSGVARACGRVRHAAGASRALAPIWSHPMLVPSRGTLQRVHAEPWWQRSTGNMVDVNSVQELVDTLAGAGDNLVIVDFYAPWCGACRALYPKLCKLMDEYPDVVFVKINFEENKQLAKQLGVKVLPFFQLYHGAEGKVAEFSCTVSKLQRMKDALDNFYTPICSLEPIPGLPEFPDIVPSAADVSRLNRMFASMGEREREPAPV